MAIMACGTAIQAALICIGDLGQDNLQPTANEPAAIYDIEQTLSSGDN
jgi:hypothetical protein